MWIERLTIEGYGPFSDEWTVKFMPSKINVISGPNESGKSTLVRGLCAVLFGERHAETERSRSWRVSDGGGGFRGVVQLRTHDGRRLRMTRNFDTETLTVSEIAGNVSNELFSGRITPGTRKGSIVAPYESLLTEILGFSSQEVFEQTLCVHQTVVPTVFSSALREIATGSARADYAAVSDRLIARCDEITCERPPESEQRRLTKPRALEIETDRYRELGQEIEKCRRTADELETIEKERDRTEKAAGESRESRDELRTKLELGKQYIRLLEKYYAVRTEHAEKLEYLRMVTDRSRSASDLDIEIERDYGEFKDVPHDFPVVLGEIESLGRQEEEIGTRVDRLKERLREKRGRGRRFAGFWFVAAVAMAVLGLGLLLTNTPPIVFYGLIGGGTAACLSGIFVWILGRASLREDRDDRDAAIEQRNSVESKHRELTDRYADIMKDRHLDTVHRLFSEYRAKMTEHTNLLAQSAAGIAEEILGGKVSELEADHAALRIQLDDISDQHSFIRHWDEDIGNVGKFLESAGRDLLHAEAASEESASRLVDIDRESAVKKAVGNSDPGPFIELREESGRKMEALQKERDALYMAWRILTESIDGFSQSTVATVCKRASHMFGEFTEGRYLRVSLTDQLEPTVDGLGRTGISPESLSTGACDQLYLALRIAFAEVLAGREGLPLILDDPFANFDSDRFRKVLQTLKLIAADRQVILLTHDIRAEQAGVVVASLDRRDGPSFTNEVGT